VCFGKSGQPRIDLRFGFQHPLQIEFGWLIGGNRGTGGRSISVENFTVPSSPISTRGVVPRMPIVATGVSTFMLPVFAILPARNVNAPFASEKSIAFFSDRSDHRRTGPRTPGISAIYSPPRRSEAPQRRDRMAKQTAISHFVAYAVRDVGRAAPHARLSAKMNGAFLLWHRAPEAGQERPSQVGTTPAINI
jgi:hypothetical protein